MRCPVDFNHDSKEHADKWEAEYREMREKCPLAWSTSHGGYWVASRYKDIVHIAQHPETFTSGKQFNPATGEASGGIIIPTIPSPRFIPDETDPPEWKAFRDLINKPLGPKAAEALRPKAREFVRVIVDRVIETGRIDFVDEFSNPLPALVTMHLMGFPLSEWKRFADPFHRLVYLETTDPAFPAAVAGIDWLRNRTSEVAAERRKAPRDDLISYLATTTLDGKPLDEQTIQQFSINIIAGGVGTTTALTTNTLLYLSRNPAERQRLIDHPEMIPRAREEFLRYFTPIHGTARNISKETVLQGEQLLPGERVLLAYASGNRDEAVFADADRVIMDRTPNPHIGFGAGIHRCVGSFVARMMFEVMLAEVLERLPDFRVLEDESRRFPSISEVNGWIAMPAVFTPGRKLGVAADYF